MNNKTVFALFSLLSFIGLVSCDDDLNSVGGSIQPPSDHITTATDTIPLAAKTVSMHDRIYARTVNGALGQYEDDMFGTVKSDYLCQFRFPEEAKFQDNVISIDSVLFSLDFVNYQGDSLAPMGLTVYPVDRALTENYYTDIDPSEYSDMQNPLTSRAYTIAGSEVISSSSSSTKLRSITSDLGIPFGQSIYDSWKNGIFNDEESFNEYFKGMYVTTTSGTGSLINVEYTSIDIYYKYNHIKGNHDGTQDTIRETYFTLSVTPEVIQLNHIKNKNPEELFVEGTDAVYLKSPAGVYTEVVFPISQIADNMEKKNMTTINSVLFSLKGYTEKEDDSDFSLGNPESLLLIPKDSIDSFFKGRKLPYPRNMQNKYALLATRSASTNSYTFGNISPLVSEYKNKGVENIVYAVLPVTTQYSYNNSTGGSELVNVYHTMLPTTAVLRNDEENMRIELVYSKF